MTVKECIDFLSTLDPDKNFVIIYDGSNNSECPYSSGEYILSDFQLMCPELAQYLNDYWSDHRIYTPYSHVPVYLPGDYCIMVG